MKIQQVEELVGITKKNIRFYEHEGLLSPSRSENGYRDYTQEDVEQLKRIKLLRSLSLPLEEIRQLQLGALTVDDAMRRHLVVLERKEISLKKAQSLCLDIQKHNETLQTLNVEMYLQKMEGMKQEGAIFMDIKKQDHRKDYIGPVVAAAIMVLFMGASIFAIMTEIFEEQLSTGMLLLIGLVILLLLAVVIGVLLALWQRIKQIKGGEEDAAAKY